jgi:hypothetical protein
VSGGALAKRCGALFFSGWFNLFVITACAANGSSPTHSSVVFMPIHTYYVSSTGSDRNSRTPHTAWATPHRGVDCGDVIIAAAGNYTRNVFGTNSWGQVSNCPSTRGGNDGRGGVYFATLLCAGPNITSWRPNPIRRSIESDIPKSDWQSEAS